MAEIKITKTIINELALSIKGQAPDSPPKIQKMSSQPDFGDIYHGRFYGFAGGVPHYYMVRGRLINRPAKPLVPLAPITSKKRNGRGVLVLPEGTLPPKKDVGPVASYILLFWPPIRVPLKEMFGKFKKRLVLKSTVVEEARRIIAELGR